MSELDNWEKLPAWLRRLELRYILVFLSTFFCGLLAHGMGLLNELSVHDDIYFLFGVGDTFTSGRWFLGVAEYVVRLIFGSGHYSLPFLNGLASIFFLAAFGCVTANLLDLRSPAGCLALGGLLVSYPMVAGVFSYMFTAPYYMLAVLMCGVGVWLVCRGKRWYHRIGGIVVLACSVGIYQAFIPVTLSLMLLYFIHSVFTARQWSWKDLLRQGIYYVLICAAFMAVYYLVNQVCLSLQGLQLTEYQGISSMGQDGLGVYLDRVKTYIYGREIFGTPQMEYMFPFRVKTLFYLLLAVAAVLSIRLVVLTFRENRAKAATLLLAMALLPMAVNFIFVMCDIWFVHFLMVYGQAMFYVYLIWLMEYSRFSAEGLKKLVRRGIPLVLAVVAVMYVRYDNIHYMDVAFQQQRTIGYLTVLVSQIKSVDGYTDTMPVAFLNEKTNSDETFQTIEAFNIRLGPKFSPWDHSWKECMDRWCGFRPKLADSESFAGLPQVEQMPHYPEDGSIQVINDTVVVKF